MTITRKRRRRKNSLHSWLICIALIASFGLMGFSLAAFQSNLYIFGTLGTADILVELDGNPHLYGYSLVERNQGDKLDTDTQEQPAGFVPDQVSVVTEDKPKGNDGNKNSADPKKSNPPVMKAFTNDAKSITLSIENAYPGDIYKLQYTVVNKGTIPVVLDLGSTSDNPHLKVKNSLPPNAFLGPGESCDEKLTITVGKSAEGEKEYRFTLELSYRQWNAD